MKGLFTLLIFFILLSNIGFSQRQQTDVINNVESTEESDILRVNFLLDHAALYKGEDQDSILSIGFKALEISKEIKYFEGEARAYLLIGNYYRQKGSLIEGLKTCNNALEIATQYQYDEIKADALNFIGLIYNYLGNYPLAMENYHEALVIMERFNNKSLIARILLNIGGVYYNLKEFNKALEFWERALDLNRSLGNKRAIAISLNNLGLAHENQGNYEESLKIFLESLSTYERDDMCGRIYPLKNIGASYLMIGNLDSAKFYLQVAYDHSVQCKDPIIQMDALVSMAEVNQLQNYPQKALVNLEQALEIGKSSGLKRETSIAMKSLSQLYEQLGQTNKAFQLYKIFHGLQDSLDTEENAKTLNRLEARFNYEKIKREEELEQKLDVIYKESQLIRERWLRNALIVAFSLMGLVALMIYLGYRRKQQSNLKLFRLNQEIEEQKHELAQQTEELQSLNIYLSDLNNNLEEKIKERTLELTDRNEELKLKNQKLAEYSFINAHKLRAPVASLLGLVKLFRNKEVKSEEKDQIVLKIEESTEALDIIVKEIREALEKDGFDDL
jgi:tetratricopeptide (TPR) repeat protein